MAKWLRRLLGWLLWSADGNADVTGNARISVYVGLALLWTLGWTFISFNAGRPLSFLQSIGFGLAMLMAVPIAAIFMWAIVFFPAIFIHEAGHWLVGMYLVEFRVWPITWVRFPKKKIRFGATSSPEELGGHVMMFPRDGVVKCNSFAWLLLGGPIASGLYFVFWMIVELSRSDSDTRFRWLYLALFALTSFIASLIPFRFRSGAMTDAMQIYELIRNRRLFLAQRAISQLSFLMRCDEKKIPAGAFESALTYAEAFETRIWVNHVSLAFWKDRSRLPAILKAVEGLIAERPPTAEERPKLFDLRLVASDVAMQQFGEIPLAARLLPPDEEIPVESLRWLLVRRACIEAVQGDPAFETTWARALESGDAPTAEDQEWIDGTRMWIDEAAPLWKSGKPFFLQWLNGQRPQLWDRESVLQTMELDVQASAKAAALIYGYYHFLDFGDVVQAKKLVEDSLKALEGDVGADSSTKLQVQIEAAYFLAAYELDLPRAQRFLPSSPVPSDLERSRLRAEAAVDVLKGNVASAFDKLDQAEALIEASEGGAMRYAFEIDGIQRVRRMAKASQPKP